MKILHTLDLLYRLWILLFPPPKTSTSQGLTFTIRQEPDTDTDEPVEFGCLSRNWDQEEALDQLMDDLDAGRINDKQALLHAQKLLAWCSAHNLGVRMLVGDISMMLGDTRSALGHFLEHAPDSPAHWYQAGQIAFRGRDYVSACTYIRRGIAANPYIAEGLTGRMVLTEHLYWHASNRYGVEWAAEYLNAPICNCTA